jgi:hypothetical protein
VAHILLLDRVMAHYGPETQEARSLLRQLVEDRLNEAWVSVGEGKPGDGKSVADPGIEPVQDILRALSPKDEAQRTLQSRALVISEQIAEAHWLRVEATSESLPGPFLVVLIFWLSLLFATFGLLAPSNMTVVLTFLVCAMSVAGAVFLIVDMAHPYLGLISVSDAPLQDALEYLGRQ